MNSLIFLSGIPGTGKTTVADFLRDYAGYSHQDLEIAWNDNLLPKDDLPMFRSMIDKFTQEKTIISWGFPTWLTAYILYIEKKGYKHIWLDGDRNVAFKMFMMREKNNPTMEKAFYNQLDYINKSKVIEQLHPTIYNPFTPDGEFKDLKLRAEEIINL